MKPLLSIVAPVYNESECLREFSRRLVEVLDKTGMRSEVIFVNDGSTDNSLEVLRSLRLNYPAFKIINLSRNFSHQIAVKAGIDHVSGDAVIIMDADLQDSPDVIPQFLEKWNEGYDVVYAIRAKREGESIFKTWTAKLFYRCLKRVSHVDIPLDTGDFRLISSKVVEPLKNMHEKHPFIRGLVSWLGYRQIGIPVHRDSRYAGKTKYTIKRMIKLAWSGVTHFSFLPLQACTLIGLVISVVSIVWMIQALYVRYVLNIAVPGWTSLIIAVLFLGSLQLITLGIFGSYLGRIYDEVRPRPLYLVSDIEGIENERIDRSSIRKGTGLS